MTAQALSTGSFNTANGVGALLTNQKGSNNTAAGVNALFHNATGANNVASGYTALQNNTTGNNNTAEGYAALRSNTTGTRNIGLGIFAGSNLTTGSNNIDIANAGSSADSGVIRIGQNGLQTAAFIAGISGSAVTGDAVVVNSSGRLGIVMSSARYKRDIRDMAEASDRLMKLRPVTFRYKNDPKGIRQYGLVAEEVRNVYPELVTHGANGDVHSVRYTVLTSMLLNELQKQERRLAQQAAQIKKVSAQTAEMARLSARVAAQQAINSRREAQLIEQAKQIKELSSQVADLTATLKQVMAKTDNRKLATAFIAPDNRLTSGTISH